MRVSHGDGCDHDALTRSSSTPCANFLVDIFSLLIYYNESFNYESRRTVRASVFSTSRKCLSHRKYSSSEGEEVRDDSSEESKGLFLR